MMDYSNAPQLPISTRKFLAVLTLVVIIFSLFELATAIYQSRTTGILQASSPSASLTVIRDNYKATNVGVGKTRVHLKPGSYEVIATLGKNQTSKTVQIKTRELTTVTLATPTTPTSQGQTQNNTESGRLIALLPYYGPNFEYVINYKYVFTNNSSQPVITITPATPSGTADAMAWISAMGFNPSGLTIQVNAQSTSTQQYQDAQ